MMCMGMIMGVLLVWSLRKVGELINLSILLVGLHETHDLLFFSFVFLDLSWTTFSTVVSF